MDADELLSLRNFFYVGAHERVDEEHKSLSGVLDGKLAAMRDVYLNRDLLERGEVQRVLDGVGKSAAASLQAVRLLARLRKAGGEDDQERADVLATLSEWLGDEGISADPAFRLVASLVLLEAGDVAQAMRLVHDGESLEHIAVVAHCELRLQRRDLAEQTAQRMESMDDDDAVTAMVGAQVAAALGGEKRLKDAMEALQEQVDKFGETVKLLNTQAACHMQLGNYTDAFQMLRQARDLAKRSGRKTHADTLVNTIVCVGLMNKPAAVPKIRAELAQSHPNHPWLRRQAELEEAFDRSAANYAIRQQ